MQNSTDRILTTHVGSLPRPQELLSLYKRKAPASELEAALKAAVAEVARKQVEAGIDFVNDGEFGKPMTGETDFGAWLFYMYDRLEGYEVRQVKLEGAIPGKDHEDFAEFYKSGEMQSMDGGTIPVGTCVAPLKYKGHAAIGRDVTNLTAALRSAKVKGGFMTAVTPDPISRPGKFYPTPEAEVEAFADAMHEEYQAIIDAGLNLQVDDPQMVNKFEMDFSVGWDMKGFRKWAERHVEIINHALKGIPPDKVRYHLCWGSWKGPHSSDLPLKDVLDLVLKINASHYSVEGANPQHEHEWEAWKAVKLPDGKAVLPGVVTHKTNILEHPEVVAQRIIRYAHVLGREKVIASTDCGMGGRIHPSIAWAKLKALSDGAALATRQLWK
jgi:5-methyltetrahydropteroyltriglutamate--homocysteine methyltransferase